MRLITCLLLGVALTACAKESGLRASSVTLPNDECALPEGWQSISARDPDYVVFGETHGTREAPAFFYSIACSLARDGERLLVAIEFSPFYDQALQDAWNADAGQFESRLLQAGWRGRIDGVASEAMFEMVRGLHRLRQAGYSIDITAFNGAGDEEQRSRLANLPGQGPHEAAQAENIAAAAKARCYDRVLVLVGNLHAEKQTIELGNGAFDPMAKRLEAYGSVLSLDMRYGAGTSWSCRLRSDFDRAGASPPADSDIDCSVHQEKANGSFGPRPFVALTDDPDDPRNENFDGFFWVGPIMASPPKAPTKENKKP